MSLTRILFLITFIESFATILVERGVYFFTHKAPLSFSDVANLWLALGFGLAYVAGALCSHRLARWLRRERRVIVAAVLAQIAVHAVMMLGATSVPVIVAGAVAVGLLNGAKWPVVESFVSAGLSPMAALRTVGRFNISWALAVPLALAAAGPIIDSPWPPALFALAGAINVCTLAMLRRLPHNAPHIPDDHPDRPPAHDIGRFSRLLVTSRWLMLGSYALMWILAAVMPGIFSRLGQPAQTGAALSGILDVVRVAAFVVLQAWAGWHSRLWPLLVSLAALPVGFAITMVGGNIWLVLLGEVCFGLATGMVYFASLYYAMVVKNAAIDAGGAHEGLIGLGFALGPLAALGGAAITPTLGDAAMLAGVAPMYVICAAGALWPIVFARAGPSARGRARQTERSP